MTGRSLIVLVAFALGACNSTGNEPKSRIFPAAQVAVVTEMGGMTHERIDANSFLLESSFSGAADGLWTGVIVGAQCGEFFAFCIPIFSVVGGATGLMIGGLSASVRGVTRRERRSLARIQESVFAAKRPGRYLEESFVRQARGRWTFVDEDPDYEISLRFEELRIIQHSEDSFSLRLKGSVAVTEPSQPDDMKPVRTDFKQLTETRSLRFYLDPTGNRFAGEFEEGIDDLAFKMVYSI